MTRDEVVAKRVAEAPPMSKGIMLRAYQGKGSPREAVKAACLICVGYEREAITSCSGFSCALWAFRPFQAGSGDTK